MVLREFKEDKVHREPKVFKVYKDRLALVLRAFKDLQAYKVLPDLMDPKVFKVFKVYREFKVVKEYKAQVALKVFKDCKDPLALVLREFKALLGCRVHLVCRAFRDLLGLKDCKELLVVQEFKVLRGCKEFKEDKDRKEFKAVLELKVSRAQLVL
jgi:hypothetical protein